MTQLGFGLGPGNYPVLRITYDNSINIRTEPASNVGKFKFDSLNGSKLGYVDNIWYQGYDSRYNAGGSHQWYHFGTGDYSFNTLTSTGYNTNMWTSGATILWTASGQGQQDLYLFKNWWPFGYMPILEVRSRYNSTPGVFRGARVNYINFGTYALVQSYAPGVSNTEAVACSGSGASGYREAYDVVVRTSNNSTVNNINNLLSVLQLPQRSDPIPNNATTVVSGQQVLLINQNTARLALPGRTVADPNPENYIFHENKIPAKIMKAGDVNVAGSGTATIICPLPLTEFTYMDFMVKKQADATFWNPPFYDGVSSNGNYDFTYTVQSDRVVITNLTGTPITVRYIIFADSDEPFTTGGKKILLKGNDGTQDYIQIKRPGSSDTAPKLNDILVDTRLAYLPILAEGFLSWTSGFPTVMSGSERFKGERKATVAVNNPSPKLKLFVKQNVIFPERCQPLASCGNFHVVFADNTGSWIGRASGVSSWANVSATEDSVDFFMSGDNPITVSPSLTNYNKENQNGNWVQVPALGLRYYVFGIPSSL